jgi:DNA-binding MarR family transcriptional regulator
MVERGLVERFADEHDRRAIRVRLSHQGLAQTARFHEHALDEVEAVVEFMGADDSRRLAELLTKASGFMAARHGYACKGRCPHHDFTEESNNQC